MVRNISLQTSILQTQPPQSIGGTSEPLGNLLDFFLNILNSNTNDAPVSSDTIIQATEDVTMSGALSTATDADGDAITYVLATQAVYGVATVNTNGTYTYIPTANFNGSDTFTYTISDGKGGTVSYHAIITVAAVNDAPVSTDTAISATEDMTVTGSLSLATDVDGDTLTYTLATQATHGTAVVNTDGSYSYLPSVNYNGVDSFTYNVSDGQGGILSLTAIITVDAVNDAPVAADFSVTTDDATAINGMLPLATDVDGDSVVYALVSSAGYSTNGTVTINSDGTYTYVPEPAYYGNDSFTYSVSDERGGVNTYTVSLTINQMSPNIIYGDTSALGSAQLSLDGTLNAMVIENDGSIVLAQERSSGEADVVRINSNDAGVTNLLDDSVFTTSNANGTLGGLANVQITSLAVAPNELGNLVMGLYGTMNGEGDAFAVGIGQDLSLGYGMYAPHDFALDTYNHPIATTMNTNGDVFTLGNSDVQQHGNYNITTSFLIKNNFDGSIDTTFGDNGIVTLAASYGQMFINSYSEANGDAASADYYASDILVQQDGKFLVSGYVNASDGPVVTVTRLNSDGSLDTSFGESQGVQGGGAYYDQSWFTSSSQIALQSDGKILLADEYGVQRLNADGTKDTGYIDATSNGDNGTDDSFGNISELLVQDDGKSIVLAHTLSSQELGGSTTDNLIIRLNTDGSIDTSFGDNGVVLIGREQAYIHEMSLDSNQNIVLGGDDGDSLFALRLNSDGSVDSSFTTLTNYDDTLIGTNSSDIFVAGYGDDYMDAGIDSASDTFVFDVYNAREGNDTVANFDIQSDVFASDTQGATFNPLAYYQVSQDGMNTLLTLSTHLDTGANYDASQAYQMYGDQPTITLLNVNAADLQAHYSAV